MAGALLPAPRRLNGTATRKAKRAYLLGYATSGVVSDGIDSAGITMSQLRNWRNADPVFRDMEEQIQQAEDDFLRRKIREQILSGNERVMMAAMKRLPEYSPTKKTEVQVTGEVKHKHVSELPEEELDKIIRAGADLIDAEFEVVGDGSGKRGGALPGVQRLPNPSVDERDTQ